MADRDFCLSLIGSICLADHMGDAANDIWRALEKLGITPPDEVSDLTELSTWLGKEHGVKTLYGTALYDPNDDCPKCQQVYYKCECEPDY